MRGGWHHDACRTNVNVLISHIERKSCLPKRPSAFAFEVIGFGSVTEKLAYSFTTQDKGMCRIPSSYPRP